MHEEFTPAAERILHHAASLRADEDSTDVQPPELLLAILADTESRGAEMLTRCNVSPERVLRQWPALSEVEPAAVKGRVSLSLEVSDGLSRGRAILSDAPGPFTLASEHLLLGLLAGQSDVSTWLEECGLTLETLAEEIRQLYGLSSEPLEVDLPEFVDRLPDSHPPQGPESSSDETLNIAGRLRVMDAAANRAAEGLRVVEDYVRFMLDDVHLTRELKTLRHEMATALGRYELDDLLACRDTRSDVGATVQTTAEYQRSDGQSLLTANFYRLQQALRSLEEFSKLTDVEAARTFERLRYQSYVLHSAVHRTGASLKRLAAAQLYVLIDGRSSTEEFAHLAGELISGGVHVLQLRDKSLNDAALLERARRLRELTGDTETLFIMNDRPDLAVLSDADGVHVGQEELPVHEVRKIVGPGRLIGLSTHSLDQAQSAVLAGADYLGAGPTFPSQTKQFAGFAGLDYLQQVHAEVRLPTFAIGGIDLENIQQVLATGARRIAVSHAICNAAQPAQAARQFLSHLATTQLSPATPRRTELVPSY